MKRRLFLQSLSLAGLGAFLEPISSSVSAQAFRPISNPESLLQSVVDAAISHGAEYADARYIVQDTLSFQVRRDQLYSSTSSTIGGVGLRVYKNGNWGYAAHNQPEALTPATLAQQATDLATLAGKIRTVELRHELRLQGKKVKWESSFKTDPFTISRKDIIDFLTHLASIPISRDEIAYSVVNFFSMKKHSLYVNSLDGQAEQLQISTYPNFGITAFDKSNGRIDSRSSMLEPRAAGYESLMEHDFAEEMQQAMYEVLEYQQAPVIQTSEYDVIIDPSVLWRILFETLLPQLDVHSILSLDGEYPGTKFVHPDSFGKALIEGANLSLQFDNTLRHGLASSGWDDAGNVSSAGDIVKDGILVAVPGADEFTSDTLPFLGSTMKSAAWQGAPRFAMPNIIFPANPSGKSLEDMVSNVEKGILLTGRGSILLSGDRRQFRSTSQLAWLIENGKRKHMVRDCVLDSSILYFWNMLGEIGGAQNEMIGGDLFPQNNNPLWETPFSISTPPARFNKISIIEGESR